MGCVRAAAERDERPREGDALDGERVSVGSWSADVEERSGGGGGHGVNGGSPQVGLAGIRASVPGRLGWVAVEEERGGGGHGTRRVDDEQVWTGGSRGRWRRRGRVAVVKPAAGFFFFF